MLPRQLQRRLTASLSKRSLPPRSPRHQQSRWITPAPKPGDGPLMDRRADRELPDISQVTFRWSRTMPIFFAIVTVAALAIFNYQKMSSPIISSTLYALRTSPKARALLGDEIYFKRQIPWIRGEMNQLQGRIDIYFTVKGSRATGTMRFKSFRPSARSLFETTEWSLEMEDGQVINLLEEGDPFKGMLGDEEDVLPADVMEDIAPTRGYRQQGPGGYK